MEDIIMNKVSKFHRLISSFIFSVGIIIGITGHLTKAEANTVNYSVAVLPYSMESSDVSNLGDEVTDLLIEAMKAEGFRTVDRRTAESATRNNSDTNAIAKSTGARIIVSGKFLSKPNVNQWFFESTITDTESGQSITNKYVYPYTEPYKDAPAMVAAKIKFILENNMNIQVPGSLPRAVPTVETQESQPAAIIPAQVESVAIVEPAPQVEAVVSEEPAQQVEPPPSEDSAPQAETPPSEEPAPQAEPEAASE